jgi:diguanylate cyclase (GGDEF)-like protein
MTGRQAQLIVVEGPDRGQTFEVPAERVVLGSGEEAGIRLSDRRAAERQAEIVGTGAGRYEIRNLDRRKNLLVNGEVVRRGRLSHGDWISVADTTLVFSEEAPPRPQALELPQIEAEELLRSHVAARRPSFDSAESVLDSIDDESAYGDTYAKRARDRLATLYRVATTVSSELNLGHLLERILELCFEVFPADRGFILLMDEDGRKLKPVASRVRDGADNGAVEFSRTIIRDVFRRQEALLSTDMGRDPRFAVGSSVSGGDITSVMCAPLVRDGRATGVIQLDTRARTQAFTRGDLDLLGAVALQCAIAIENARAYKRRQEYSRNLVYLARAMQRLASSLDRERICRDTVKASCTLLGCTKGSLLLQSEPGKPLRLVYAIGMSRRLAKSLVRNDAGDRFAQQVLETGEPLLVARMADLPEDARPSPDPEREQRYAGDSFVIVPIYAAGDPAAGHGRTIGVLCVADKISRGAFHGNDQELLQILASQAGAALTNAELYEKATVDTLTRVYVRRHFMQQLDEAVANASYGETRPPLALVLIDIDHFKSVNDVHGHLAGDAVLRSFGRLLKQAVRAGMVCGRYGGEEFCVLCPGLDAQVAARLAERLRAAVAAQEFRITGGLALRRTASFGVAQLLPGEGSKSLIERADRALYEAKSEGRDRVVIATDRPPSGRHPSPASG